MHNNWGFSRLLQRCIGLQGTVTKEQFDQSALEGSINRHSTSCGNCWIDWGVYCYTRGSENSVKHQATLVCVCCNGHETL
ncbi:hypothetical protein PLEOSDRAFT_1089207 [Pleurotus ostreatus PC15]|uniref:Uncharacterized protein n=1 Tax=Pleurotus ostreatus (strain PC15) TaxID=1137138 RepID=A0A067NNL3_PLEO1|nr:hypothetical protein PLEOSDRAFT_1089207 [Pleurotus ostreatus PC15]